MPPQRTGSDGEKDDKIRAREANTKKTIWMVFFGLAALSLVYVYQAQGTDGSMTTSFRPPPGLRREIESLSSALHPQEAEDPPQDAADVAHLAATDAEEEEEEAEDAGGDDESLDALIAKAAILDQQVREIKKTGIIMETDPESLRVTGLLQEATRNLLRKRYGDYDHYRVRVNVEFQPSHPDYETGKDGYIIIDMAPIEYIPVSVYNFMEIARTWRQGAFHRNAGHVLQVRVRSGITRFMPFQEYSPNFPHKKGTAGYAGRPSGPAWYVSIQDNSVNHGPGSQQKKNPHEADSNFGTVVEGMDDVVPKIHRVPQGGWLDKDKEILIPSMQILVPDGAGGWKEFVDETNGRIAFEA